MKVLMISEYFPPFSKGGGELSAFALAKELSKKNIKVHILTSFFKGSKKIETVEKVKVFRLLKTGKDPYSFFGNIKRIFFERSLLKELLKLHKKEKYDIIHCMNSTSVSAVKLKNKIKKPFIVHVNSPVLFCPKGTLMYKDKKSCEQICSLKTYLGCFLFSKNLGKIKMPFYLKYNPLLIFKVRKNFEKYQKLLPMFDHFMAISSYMKKRLVFSGVEEKKISIVYNLIGLENFLNLKKSKNNIKTILYLGPYTEPKGSLILLKALNNIKLDFKANFYGKGVLDNMLKKNSGKKININKHADFSEIPNIIEQHDILVFPSLVAEAFGRAALEACAAGKIVIASNIGGIPDIIDNNKTGFLFEPGDVEELKELLEKAIKGDLKIDGKKTKEIVKEKFSKEKTIEKIINIYKKLIM